MDREDIVIIGGGLCGLATALALHRKGIKSVVLEKSDKLREGGIALSIVTNGWRALDQLGVASKLRTVSFPVLGFHDIVLDNGTEWRTSASNEEIRTFRRMHLIEALANELPEGTIRFGYQISAITLDPDASYPTIHLHDGTTINAKVVIGCDGAYSRVAECVGLRPIKHYKMSVIREKGLLRIRKGNVIIGRIPMGDNLVYWFLSMKSPSHGSNELKDSNIIKELGVQAVHDFPSETLNMVKQSDINTLHFYNLHYRPPWNLFLENFSKGNVIVAGDSMHLMAPALGQGGSAALEDSIVLARCMANNMLVHGSQNMDWGNATLAFTQFVKERRLRLWWLSLNTHLILCLGEYSSSKVMCLFCIFLITLLFRKPLWDAQYDWVSSS
ncbi:Monooxygenase 1 [Bienertia sinuspersici]